MGEDIGDHYTAGDIKGISKSLDYSSFRLLASQFKGTLQLMGPQSRNLENILGIERDESPFSVCVGLGFRFGVLGIMGLRLKGFSRLCDISCHICCDQNLRVLGRELRYAWALFLCSLQRCRAMSPGEHLFDLITGAVPLTVKIPTLAP